jgi:hypothetical protein
MKEMYFPRTLAELQWWQGTWSGHTFATESSQSLLNHLKRELKELESSGDPEEAADCLLLLLSYAHRNRIDLFSEAVKKYYINQRRKWGQPDAEGVVEHIRD